MFGCLLVELHILIWKSIPVISAFLLEVKKLVMKKRGVLGGLCEKQDDLTHWTGRKVGSTRKKGSREIIATHIPPGKDHMPWLIEPWSRHSTMMNVSWAVSVFRVNHSIDRLFPIQKWSILNWQQQPNFPYMLLCYPTRVWSTIYYHPLESLTHHYPLSPFWVHPTRSTRFAAYMNTCEEIVSAECNGSCILNE